MKFNRFGVWCWYLGFYVFDAQEICKTPTDLDGQCVPIDDCEKLKNLVQKSAQERVYVMQWTCGYNDRVPLVCCPKTLNTCITVSGKPGACKPLELCPFLLTKLKTKPVTAENLEYVQRARYNHTMRLASHSRNVYLNS